MSKRKPLGPTKQSALALLKGAAEPGNRDWFIFDAMEVLAEAGFAEPYAVLEALYEGGAGRIYDGGRKFELVEGEAADGPADQEDLVSEPDETGADSTPDLDDEDIAALAAFDGGEGGGNGVPGEFRDQELLGMVLVELMVMQLERSEGLPVNPTADVFGRLTAGRSREGVTATGVRDAIHHCKKKGWLRKELRFARLFFPATLAAYRFSPGRLAALAKQDALAYEFSLGVFVPVDRG